MLKPDYILFIYCLLIKIYRPILASVYTTLQLLKLYILIHASGKMQIHGVDCLTHTHKLHKMNAFYFEDMTFLRINFCSQIKTGV